MFETDETAKQIAMTALEATDASIMAGEFDAFAFLFALPHRMEINGVSQNKTTLEELKIVFDRFQRHLQTNRVTLLERHCISAAFLAPDLIHTTHETRLVAGRELVEDPYPVFSTLRNGPNGWRIDSSKTAFPERSTLRRLSGQHLQHT